MQVKLIRIISAFTMLLFCFLILPAIARAEVNSIDRGYAENIKNYSVDINIKKDRSIEVNERIIYDFGSNEKHGIYRYIPYYYGEREGSPYISIKNVRVTNQNDKKIKFEKEKASGNVVIKIGDPNKLVTGQQIFNISYTVDNAASLYSDYAEFYWDAIGENWEVPIESVLVTLAGEDNLIENSDFRCYTGVYGTTSECQGGIDSDNQVKFPVRSLTPWQAVTVKSGFEKSAFEPLGFWQKMIWETRWYLAIPFLFAVLYVFLWAKYGRDPAKSGAIVVQYAPPKGMTPMIAGIVTKPLKAAQSYLAAEIINLAVGGYLKIKQFESNKFFKTKDYELTELKKGDNKLAGYQKEILNAFFDGRNTITLSGLKNDTSFGQKIRSIPGMARDESITKKYFPFSPVTAVILSLVLTVGLIIFSIVIFSYFQANGTSFAILSLTWPVMIIFSFLTPKRTLLGLKTAEYLAGLKTYINYAEKDRIKFLNEPKKSPEKFEELLPYAIVFNLEKEWAKQFMGIYKQPNWYEGDFHGGFTAAVLAHNLGGFSSATTTSVHASAPTSSSGMGGGGFSGGGGGGGGGGSW